MEDYGIAPPVSGSADKRELFAEAPKVRCPKCKDPDTRMLSLHGSTACKSQYVCNSCLEPGSADKRELFAEAPKVRCPKCKDPDTRMLSLHGSTACKSQYVCNSCLEPFEYFKCL